MADGREPGDGAPATPFEEVPFEEVPYEELPIARLGIDELESRLRVAADEPPTDPEPHVDIVEVHVAW
jgi:hypothetical protein